MKRITQRGFTLIELLVVIAVIGILAGIVISSLDVSKRKAQNTGIKANMRTISQQVELVYINTSPNGYGTVSFPTGTCAQTANTIFADATIWKAILEIQKQSGGTMPTCSSTTKLWAVSALLRTPENGNTYWCIETEGKAKGESADITTPSCP